MATVQSSVSDLVMTVKSREIQRGMLAEARRDGEAARRHFLAAAHLELVLAEDYQQNGDNEMAFRSRLSAASCLWRGGDIEQAQWLLSDLADKTPARVDEIRQVTEELQESRDRQ